MPSEFHTCTMPRCNEPAVGMLGVHWEARCVRHAIEIARTYVAIYQDRLSALEGVAEKMPGQTELSL